LEIQPFDMFPTRFTWSRSHDWTRSEKGGRYEVVFHADFYEVYTDDPAAAPGRMEAIMTVIEPHVELVKAQPADEAQIAVHHAEHIERIRGYGLYDIAALAAGGPQAAAIGLGSLVLARSGCPGTMPRPAPAGDSATSTTWRWPLRR
jgi:hypothetical protein